MEKIDKISKYGNIIFAVVLYTLLTTLIVGHVTSRLTKYDQAQRLMTYDYWHDGDCFNRVDINWIIYGINE